jgi:hypothetical protein
MVRPATHETTPIYRLIPRSRARSNWLPTGDRIEILVPRFRDPVFGPLLRRVTRPDERWIRYRLDPRASRIYAQIDGYRTVADLADIYRQQHPEDAQQVTGRVWGLLQSLESQGFLEFKKI